jgi:F-type H+-transporting ATPase subunit delta
MAEKTTLARPYAVAAYRLAKQHKGLDQWSDMLALLAGVAADAEMALVIANPKLTGAQAADRTRQADSVAGDCRDV